MKTKYLFKMGSRKEDLKRTFGCFVLLGFFACAIAQGNPDRRWSVRKTGEFGRRIESLPKELQLPTRHFKFQELNLDLSESRRYDLSYSQGAGIKQPSLDLELPHLNSLSPDQEAQETGESDGYVYAPPEDQEGYDYNTPSPVAGPNEEDAELTTPPSEPPIPVEPNVVAGPGDQFFSPLARDRETDEDIDSTGLSADRRRPKPSSPQVSAVGNNPSDQCTDYNDPNCWTHDYSDVIPGVAGTDYPVLSEILETNFDCNEQTYSGYYADFDEVARCQMFHICLKNNKYRKTRKWSFLCPNGTIFSQQDLVCVLWTDAPECDQATVRSLYNINQELGWDNVTEGTGTGNRISSGHNSNGEIQSAMSAFRAALANKSSTNTRYDSNPNPPPRSGLPYRVPVKVNEHAGKPRTKLQEVTRNALHGTAHELDYGDNTEHDVEESSNFETSLRKQTQSQHRTKSSSDLRTTTSEAYELKGSPDGVQPFIVNRPKGHNPTEASDSGYGTDDQTEEPQHVVMMPTIQRLPDGSSQYAEVPVMLPHGAYTDSPEEGYRYPHPTEGTSTPAPAYLPPSTTQSPPTTTEDFPPPAIPTEPPLDHDNYEADYQNSDVQSTTENVEESGYQYPNPSTTERSEEGFNLPRRTNEQQSDGGYQYPDPSNTEGPEEGYRYPQPTTTENPEEGYRYPNPTSTEGSDEGYRYPQPTSTEGSEEGYRYPQPTSTEGPEEGYKYPQPTSTEGSKDGYKYPQPTTTEGPEEGYRYSNPTTARSSSRYENTTPPTAQQPTGSEEESDAGYQYPIPNEQLGYNYPSPTTTEQSTQNDHTKRPNEQYQVTDNEVSGGYVVESTTYSNVPNKNQDSVDSTESSVSTTTLSPDNSTPAGAYLPPSNNDEINNGKQVEVDEDTVGISGGDGEEDSDYDEEENEVVTGPTGSPEDSGYAYNYPTPPSSGSTSNPAVLSGGALDSDDKVNEILKQIQNGGIEAVDANGKPIAFDKLKDLLLTSPRGSVELKGLENVDSVTSPSTEIPTSPQTEQPRPPQKEQPFYQTITTANVLPNNDNVFNTNQNQLTVSSPRDVRPSPSLYLPPPNTNNNNNVQQQQQYYTNNNNLFVERPTYEIKVPNREFETHSVLTNTIDSNNNRNSQFVTNSQNQNQPNQYRPQINDQSYYSPRPSPPQVQNIQYQVQQEPTPQQQFFPTQNFPSNPTLATTLVIPNDPSSSHRQAQQAIQRPPFQNNLIIPAPQAQIQTEVIPSAPSVQQPQGQYLPPPRQATSSILQSQFYNGEASSNSQSRKPFVSQPIQLTDNIQLQQSFGETLQFGGSGNSNPLANPKDIKIVPAVFVHQHTSIASQNENGLSGGSRNIDTTFQNLDTAQSVYLPFPNAGSKFGTSSIAEQLNQLANSVYLPQGSSTGRQFTRRSNGGSSSSRGRSSSLPASPSSEPSHTIEKATQVTTFTLEDARSPDELQKYHHQDLKRFHSENIAKQGGVLDDSYVAPPVERPTQSIPRVQHRFVTQRPTTTNNDRRNSHRADDTQRNGSSHRGGGSSSNRGSGGGGSTSSSHSNGSNAPERFSLNDSNLSNKGRSNGEDFFIPVSGSYGGGSSGSSRSSTTSSRNSNSEGSQFRISGRGGGGGRSYVDSESETTLLSRFLPEENGGFGSRLG